MTIFRPADRFRARLAFAVTLMGVLALAAASQADAELLRERAMKITQGTFSFLPPLSAVYAAAVAAALHPSSRRRPP